MDAAQPGRALADTADIQAAKQAFHNEYPGADGFLGAEIRVLSAALLVYNDYARALELLRKKVPVAANQGLAQSPKGEL
jgi:Flp pilus assembly protein TadG